MSVTVSSPMGAMIPQTMDQAARLAEMMSKGKLVPSHLQGSPGDCLMVIEMAMRFGMSPFAVAQCTSVIQGKLMLEGKLVAAALHGSGALATRLSYDYSGEGAARAVTVSAVLAGETEPRTMTIKLADVKTTNQLWTKQPDQQLAYSAARNWARRYAPEVMLGVYSPEEMEVPAKAPAPAHAGPTIDGVAEPVSRDAINAAVPLAADPPRKPTFTEWLAGMEPMFRGAKTPEAIATLTARDDVQTIMDKGTEKQRVATNALIDAAIERLRPAQDPVAEFVGDAQEVEA